MENMLPSQADEPNPGAVLLADGQREFFENVLEPYREELLKYLAFQGVASHADREDIVQDAFLKVMRYKKEIDPERVKGLLLTICYQLRCNLFEGKHAAKKLSIGTDVGLAHEDEADGAHRYDLADARSRSPLEELLERERALLAQEAVAHLPPLHGDMLSRMYFQGESVEEIAKNDGKTRGAISLRLTRARKALREQLVEGQI